MLFKVPEVKEVKNHDNFFIIWNALGSGMR